MGEVVSDQLVPASTLCESSVDFLEIFGMGNRMIVFFWPMHFAEDKCLINEVECFLRIKKIMVHFHFF